MLRLIQAEGAKEDIWVDEKEINRKVEEITH